MKKIIIIGILTILTLILSSCGNNEGLTEKTDLIKESNIEVSTGKVEVIKNKEEIIEEIKVEEVKISSKKLIMKNSNVFLQEEGKEDEVLTTRATGQTSCSQREYFEKNPKTYVGFYTYEIIYDKGKYGLVKRVWYTCGGVGRISLYVISLEKEMDSLFDISEYMNFEGGGFDIFNVKIEGDKLTLETLGRFDETEVYYTNINLQEVLNK